MYYIESVNIYIIYCFRYHVQIFLNPIVLRYKKFRKNDKIIKKTMNFEIIIRLSPQYHLCVWWYKLCGVLTL